jgi:hypothetical protein
MDDPPVVYDPDYPGTLMRFPMLCHSHGEFYEEHELHCQNIREVMLKR